MNSTTFNFVRPGEVLPRWMAARRPDDSGNGQLWPDQVPVGGAQQLPGNPAVGNGFDLKAAPRGESDGQPVLKMLPGNTDSLGDGGFSSNGEKSPIKGGSGFKHVNIVHKQSPTGKADGKQDAPVPVVKLGMNIWKRIENELHRRRLNPMWLARKLDVTRQVINGWKKRGVPTRRYEEIATALGWSLDRLVMGADDAPPVQQAMQIETVAQVSVQVAAPPVNPAATCSPLGLDLAAQFDAIPDDEQRLRAYALIMQIIRMSSAPQPTPPAQQQAEPGLSPMTTPHRAK